MRHWLRVLMLGTLPLVSGIAHGGCLPTLGMDDCFRAADPRVQAIEHYYLDAPARNQDSSRAGRHRLNKHPRLPSKTS
jgi:hypothetical protein